MFTTYPNFFNSSIFFLAFVAFINVYDKYILFGNYPVFIIFNIQSKVRSVIILDDKCNDVTLLLTKTYKMIAAPSSLILFRAILSYLIFLQIFNYSATILQPSSPNSINNKL